jgi:NAD(P)-dependent dehydrogenase (short-subunit alcohol dehydrogenase family)
VKEFNGKIVVVTGAASGIGRETALAFGRRGSHLAVCDIDEAGLLAVRQELEGLGCLVHSEVVDVSRAEEVERFCDNVYSRFARVDVLVNNAGIAVGGPVEYIPLDGWRRIVGINLWGVIHGCHFFYPRMIEQGGGGSIVNIASSAAYAPNLGLGAYACTKHAVLGLSETMRIEGAMRGIHVSTICPGVVNTPIYSNIDYSDGSGRVAPAEVTRFVRKFADRFGCHPSKVAATVIDAVERNRGVVPVGPGARQMDISRRISRELYNRVSVAVALLAERLVRHDAKSERRRAS